MEEIYVLQQSWRIFLTHLVSRKHSQLLKHFFIAISGIFLNLFFEEQSSQRFYSICPFFFLLNAIAKESFNLSCIHCTGICTWRLQWSVLQSSCVNTLIHPTSHHQAIHPLISETVHTNEQGFASELAYTNKMYCLRLYCCSFRALWSWWRGLIHKQLCSWSSSQSS